MKCYNDVLEVINAAADEFYGSLALNKERVAELETACDLMDTLAEGFDAEFIDSEIDDRTGVLSLSIEVPEIVLKKGKTHGFFELITAAKAFGFAKIKGDNIRFAVEFDGLWTVV